MTTSSSSGSALYASIREVLAAACTTRRAVNDAMVQAYWQVGRLIVEDEQGGERRAEYSALSDSPQLFASRYSTILPTEDELRAELERDRALLEAAHSQGEQHR